jgi:DNA polymerase-1
LSSAKSTTRCNGPSSGSAILRSSLAKAVAHYCGHALTKDEQASDWGAETLTPAQIAYAGADAVWLWRLRCSLEAAPARRRAYYEAPLVDQAEAYRVANAAVPAFVRLNNRGVLFDPDAHGAVLRALAAQGAAASEAYRAACLETGYPALAERVPRTPAETAAALETILSEAELAAWPRVNTAEGLTVKKTELLKAAHYAPVVAMLGLAEARMARSQWGETLPGLVHSDGRLYPAYRIAGAASGRSSASGPNIQGVPRDPRFRVMFKAAPGFVFVAADYGAIDLRTFAYFFEDAALADVFTRDGDAGDPHTLMARRVTGRETVTPEERSKAKGVNFGTIYGIQAPGLVEQIWKLSPEKPIRVTVSEAQHLLDAFAQAYPDAMRNRGAYATRCLREQRIVIGRDRHATTGRIIPLRRLRRDQNPTTCAFAYPIQGINAVIAMAAMADIDRELRVQRVDGGLVIFNHDEFVLEVREKDVERAKALLKAAMERAFLEVFPGAALNKLVEVHVGPNWAATKEKNHGI